MKSKKKEKIRSFALNYLSKSRNMFLFLYVYKRSYQQFYVALMLMT